MFNLEGSHFFSPACANFSIGGSKIVSILALSKHINYSKYKNKIRGCFCVSILEKQKKPLRAVFLYPFCLFQKGRSPSGSNSFSIFPLDASLCFISGSFIFIVPAKKVLPFLLVFFHKEAMYSTSPIL